MTVSCNGKLTLAVTRNEAFDLGSQSTKLESVYTLFYVDTQFTGSSNKNRAKLSAYREADRLQQGGLFPNRRQLALAVMGIGIEGSPGKRRRATGPSVVEGLLRPNLLTANTRILYLCPISRLATLQTVTGGSVDPTLSHFFLMKSNLSTWQESMGRPQSVSGTSHSIVSVWVVASTTLTSLGKEGGPTHKYKVICKTSITSNH